MHFWWREDLGIQLVVRPKIGFQSIDWTRLPAAQRNDGGSRDHLAPESL